MAIVEAAGAGGVSHAADEARSVEPSLPVESGTLSTRSFHSQVLQREYEYRLYLPPAYDSASRYPVLYLLHGRGDTMTAWDTVAPDLDRLIAEQALPPVICIVPDNPSSNRAGYYVDSLYSGDSSGQLEPASAESAFVDDLLPHVDATYATVADRAGRVVAGYSMGGYGAVRYLLAHPELFSAGLVLSPAVYTPLPPAESSARRSGAFGVDHELFSDERYRELNYPAMLERYTGGRYPARVFIAVGDDEWKHPDPEDALHDIDVEAHLLYNRLVRVAGVDAELRVYGGGHDWTVWRRGFVEGLQHMGDHLRMSLFRLPSGE